MKMKNILLTVILAFAAVAFTGCDLEDITGYAYTETGGEYTVSDEFGNVLTFDREQTKQIAKLGQQDAEAFLTARFESQFPASYSAPGAVFAIARQSTTPTDVQINSVAQVAANVPGVVSPGVGSTVSVVLNALLGIGLVGYRAFKLKQISRKDAALDGAGRLIDGIYNVAEVLPDKEQGKRVVKVVDQGLDLVFAVTGAADELKRAVKRTETPSIDSSIYN